MNQSLFKPMDLTIDKHDRLSEFNQLVYPVVSRRSKGLSLGINMNPDKKCVFDCEYCQVDRTVASPITNPALEQVEKELVSWLDYLLKEDNQYKDYNLMDIAVAGDGEPTTEKILPEVLELMVRLKENYQLKNCKLVLFTNGAGITKKALQDSLDLLFSNMGEVWFKLDAWDDESYQRINRSQIPYSTILKNLVEFSRQHPVVLQSCIFKETDQPANTDSFLPLLQRILDLEGKGAAFQKIQLYTVARKPAESWILPLSNEEMNVISKTFQDTLKFPVETYFEK